MVNKHGLGRDVGAKVKRKVRIRCGYGCVICGEMFCHYHHFDPEFEDATEHDPDGITLLCAKHHDEVTRGRMSNKRIFDANAKPYSKKENAAKYIFEDLKYPLEVALGGLVFITANGTLLKVDGEELLSVKMDKNRLPVLSGSFHTEQGETLIIKNNELITNTGHWDIESKGQEIIIRAAPGKIIFHLIFNPPHRLQVVNISNYHKGHKIDTKFGKKLFVSSASGASINFASGFIVIGGALELDSKKGIIITGGSFVLGSEDPGAFKNTSLDHLISQVNVVRELNKVDNES